MLNVTQTMAKKLQKAAFCSHSDTNSIWPYPQGGFRSWGSVLRRLTSTGPWVGPQYPAPTSPPSTSPSAASPASALATCVPTRMQKKSSPSALCSWVVSRETCQDFFFLKKEGKVVTPLGSAASSPDACGGLRQCDSHHPAHVLQTLPVPHSDEGSQGLHPCASAASAAKAEDAGVFSGHLVGQQWHQC